MDFQRDIYKELLYWKEKNTGRVLELEGARQVGKTYILNKFSTEQYKQNVYINMIGASGQRFTKCLEENYDRNENNRYMEKPIHEALRVMEPEFQDRKSTVVIIDEIQESPFVYSRIREFAREFTCDFIVTGSYLGKTREKDFFLSAGDTDHLIMTSMSFPEFLEIWGKRDLYKHIDLYGTSDHGDYKELKEYFDIYCQIGGYPRVVQTYIDTKNVSECRKTVKELIDIFVRESSRYFESALEQDLFGKMFSAISVALLKEKKGTDDLISDFSKIVFREESGRITKKMVNASISWLYLSHIIGYCSKSIDCNHLDLVDNCRYYFTDLGVANYFLRKTGENEESVKGVLCENYVYLCLLKSIRGGDTIAGDVPWFAVYKSTGGELDFYVRSLVDYKNYGIEVKAGDNVGKTARCLLEAGKIDFLYYLKGDTFGGKSEDGKTLTVPIYLAERVSFDRKRLI